MTPEPLPAHRWLARLAGDWTYDAVCTMGPDQPPTTMSGTERVRMLGDLWAVAEAEITDASGPGRTIMTLGYDSTQGGIVGTFVASMMTYLWKYGGALDEEAATLTLEAEGPGFTGEPLARYRDVIALLSDDHRTLTSSYLAPDGQWQQFQVITYRRVSR